MIPITALARAHGIQTAYYDVDRKRRKVPHETIVAVLRALGAIETEDDTADALRERTLALWRRPMEPVVVAWHGKLEATEIRLLAAVSGKITWTIRTESGETVEGATAISNSPTVRRETVGGQDYVSRELRINQKLPLGYHRLIVTADGAESSALVISAPVKAYDPFIASGRREWGAFAPLHALRSPDYWGAGDFSDLERLAGWVAEKGGTAVMTLPLLASFLDEPFNPSPYSPVSRLFWNEMYIDVERIPELADCAAARETIASPRFQQSLHELRRTDLVDYRGVMALKRCILEQLAVRLFEKASARRNELEQWADAHPDARDYAHFRGAIERTSAAWRDWPETMRDGEIRDAEYDSRVARYHLFVQWLAESQIFAAAEKSNGRGVSLFFDVPLGVDRAGYDVWRHRGSFIDGVSAGAPPDEFFTRGQNWGFPPLSPDGERETGYRYFRASITHLLRIAGMLRIDHVMGLHRLYWIPHGMAASEGAYVRHHADEMYAILCLESHRHEAAIMGEDLGTVPHFVRRAMSRHDLLGSYVLQFELPGKGPVRKPPRKTVASLNTHDMPPFAAFWRGLDIDDRLELGHIDDATAERQRKERAASRKQLTAELKRSGKLVGEGEDAPVTAAERWLLDSRSSVVLVNVEDLWQETAPQNVPGTTDERPNWRRKMRSGLEDLAALDVPGENITRAEVAK